MEAKNVIAFEYVKEDRIYRLQMPHGAPLGEAYEATGSFLAEMVRMINAHSESLKSKESEKEDEANDPESSEKSK